MDMPGHSQTSISPPRILAAKEGGLGSPMTIPLSLNPVLHCKPLASCTLSNGD